MKTNRTVLPTSSFRNLFTRGSLFTTVVPVVAGTVVILTSTYYLGRAQANRSIRDRSSDSTPLALPVQSSSGATSFDRETSIKPPSTLLVSTKEPTAKAEPTIKKEVAVKAKTPIKEEIAAKEAAIPLLHQPAEPPLAPDSAVLNLKTNPVSTDLQKPNEQQFAPTENPLKTSNAPTPTPSIEPPQSTTLDSLAIANEPILPVHRVNQEGPIQLVGIVRETRFQNNQYIQDLEQLWSEYAESDALLNLESTLDNKTYVAYTNYSEDGDRFTLVIGHRVANFDNIPSGLSQISIPAATYAQFQVTGNLDGVIANTWKSIETANLQRAYGTDLEIYDYQQDNAAEVWASVN